MPFYKKKYGTYKKKSTTMSKKRSTKKTTGLSKLYREIAKLKVNKDGEKKTTVQYLQNAAVGQVTANNSGHFIADITPVPSQGTQSTNRIGNSIKHCSSYMAFQFYQQANAVSPMRIKVQVIRVIASPWSSLSGVTAQIYDPNPFISGGANIYDTNCSRNIDFFKNYKIIATKSFTLKADNFGSQVMIKNLKIGLKYRDKYSTVKFSTDGSQTLASGQLLLLITADSGNWNTSTASTLSGIPILSSSTGATFQYNLTHYYYDD